MRSKLGKVDKALRTNLEEKEKPQLLIGGWLGRGRGSYFILLCVGPCKLGYGFASIFYYIDVEVINILISEMLVSNH